MGHKRAVNNIHDSSYDKIEIVKNAITLGMDNESISKLTGLSIDEISKMRVEN